MFEKLVDEKISDYFDRHRNVIECFIDSTSSIAQVYKIKIFVFPESSFEQFPVKVVLFNSENKLLDENDVDSGVRESIKIFENLPPLFVENGLKEEHLYDEDLHNGKGSFLVIVESFYHNLAKNFPYDGATPISVGFHDVDEEYRL